jgi:hypothetical protein
MQPALTVSTFTVTVRLLNQTNKAMRLSSEVYQALSSERITL